VPEDDFIASVLDTVSTHVPISKPKRDRIDADLRLNWGGAPVYVLKNSPTRRQSIRDATGTYAEIAAEFNVSLTTVWRVRKGR